MNNLIGRRIQFDISELGYKEGIIKDIKDGWVTILQDCHMYRGAYYLGQTIRERNLRLKYIRHYITKLLNNLVIIFKIYLYKI